MNIVFVALILVCGQNVDRAACDVNSASRFVKGPPEHGAVGCLKSAQSMVAMQPNFYDWHREYPKLACDHHVVASRTQGD